MNIQDAEITNQTALETLGNGHFLAAQELFRQNAKKNPCFLSLNNLGVYYITEGMELQNGHVRNARKLGLKFLKRAETLSQSPQNLMAIGDVYSDDYSSVKDYKSAINYFRRACALNSSYFSFNNLGACLYIQGEYIEASECFEKALDYCNDSDYSDICQAKSSIFSSYAFSLLKYDKIKCHDVLMKMHNSNICHIEEHEFVLAFLCSDLKLAKDLCKQMFDTWHIDISVMSMIFNLLFKLGENDEAKEYLRLQIESLEGYNYDISKDVNGAKKAFSDRNYREKAIKDYQYVPPIMKDCYYINCKMHNLK